MATISEPDIKKIVTNSEQAELLVKQAEQFGKALKESGLTTSQIRALFGEVRQIQGLWSMGNEQQSQARRRLILLKPKMAYRAKKESGIAVKELVEVLEPALNYVVTAQTNEQAANFTRFVEFFEAILAYHKAAGGK
ncbi:MAG: type III-A CRISPR-associated protein Csm2 [Anaerolineae bacterium]|nr:type III-A CRISPR-associated protein Csm2 [Anaerolineae bacterium]